MATKYMEDYDTLVKTLECVKGSWSKSKIKNAVVFHSESGHILNWFLGTGTLQFQGRPSGLPEFKDQVFSLLFSEIDITQDDCYITEDDVQYPTRNNDNSCECKVLNEVAVTDTSKITNSIKDHLSGYDYEVDEIKVSQLLNNNLTDAEDGSVE